MTEPEAPEAPTRRGRPRPQETLDRDEQVFKQVEMAPEGTTRDAVAAALGIGANQVYLSFYRLKRDGRIQRVAGASRHTWTVVSEGAAT